MTESAEKNFPAYSHLPKQAGRPFIQTCLLLYYTSQKEDLPLWTKLLIYSALAYFISPIDAIPDPLLMGLSDDIAVLSAALASITAHIDDRVRAQTTHKLCELFGRD